MEPFKPDKAAAGAGTGTFTGTESDVYGISDAVAVQNVGHKYGPAKTFMGVDITQGKVTGLKTMTILELLKKLAGMPKAEIEALQDRLLRGGYYPHSIQAADLPLGQADDLTYNAYTALLIQTARANLGGEQVTWEEVLEDQIEARGDTLPKGAPFAISDTQGLIATVQEIARSKRGRPLDTEHAELFAEIMQQMQTGAGTASSGAVSQPDVQARAEAFVLEQDPKGVAAYTAADYMDAAMEVLGLGH